MLSIPNVIKNIRYYLLNSFNFNDKRLSKTLRLNVTLDGIPSLAYGIAGVNKMLYTPLCINKMLYTSLCIVTFKSIKIQFNKRQTL